MKISDQKSEKLITDPDTDLDPPIIQEEEVKLDKVDSQNPFKSQDQLELSVHENLEFSNDTRLLICMEDDHNSFRAVLTPSNKTGTISQRFRLISGNGDCVCAGITLSDQLYGWVGSTQDDYGYYLLSNLKGHNGNLEQMKQYSFEQEDEFEVILKRDEG